MNEVASQTLSVVSKELSSTLGLARQALENYAEREDQVGELARCAELLHEVHGVLRLVEVYGASLLAEEMEQVARYLVQTADDRKHHAEGLDALLRAMVQLPAYLERVLGGGRDLALVVLPLLNDLRAVRGNALLSEGTLLLLNLTSDRQPQPAAPQPGEPPMSVAQWARRLRSRFQVGLLGWIRGERREQNLEILAAVAEKLEQIATRQPVFQLWWVVGAVIESIKEHGLEGNASVNRLLGQADRELKRLYEIGETRYAESPPVELLNNLLYYVARATSQGPRATAVRASFKLQELLPVDAEVQQERENLSAPSVKLMKTVAAAIKEDLSRVKDVLDIFMRKGGSQVEELATQVEMLKKISDTLGVLGLGSLRQRVQDEIARLHDLVSHRTPVSDTVLVDIAATLISVEDNLDDQLVRLIMPVLPSGSNSEGDDSEFRAVQQAVLRECIVNLARIKEAIAATIARQPEFNGADAVPQLARGITAGLLMLGKARAVEIMESINGYIEEVLRPGAPLPAGRLERIADAIVSIEYYMETLQSGRSDPWYMLDNADACLAALREAPSVLADAPVTSDSGYARTLQISVPPPEAAPAAPAFTGTTTDASVAVPVPVVPKPKPAPAEVNSEFRDLFLEEAREELAIIEEYFPAWDENPGDQESLVRVRRSFHTLKGSGRMVGATTIGEFAWAIENLLNRFINGTLTRSPSSLGLLREAVGVLSALIEQLATGEVPVADIGLLIGRAQAIAEGRDPETAVAVVLPAETEPVAAAPSPGPVEVPAPVAAPVPELPAITSTAIIPAPDFAEIFAAAPPAGDAVYAATEVLPPDEIVAVAPAPPAPEPAAPAPVVVNAAAAPVAEAPAEFANTEVLPSSAQTLEPPSSRFVRYPSDKDSGSASDKRVSAMPPPPPRSTMPAPEPSEGPDLMLVEIYRSETASHVATVREYLKSCVGKFAPYPVTEALHRACHTLSGASKMAEARHSIRIAEPLNLYIRKLYDHGLGLPEAGRRMLSDAVDAMEYVAQHIDEATIFFTTHDDILARLKWLDSDADRQIAAAGLQPQERSGDVPLTPAPFEDLLSADELITKAAATPAPAAAPQPPAPAPVHAAETPALRPATAPEPAPAPEADEFDAEIAAIFCEEATELLEIAEGTLQKFRADPATPDPLTELQRVLHTLKGGARMAGIRAMGDLSHELESLLIQMTGGLIPDDQRTMDVVQASLDELSRMRDTVSGGRRVVPARDLITRIKALGRGGGPVPPVLKAVAPEQPMPTPSVAPPPAPPVMAPPVVTDIAATTRETRVLVMPEPLTPPAPAPTVIDPVPEPVASFAATLSEIPPPIEAPAVVIDDGAEGSDESLEASAPISRFVATPRAEEPSASPAAEPEVPALEESRSIVLPPGREQITQEPRELARVDADLLDTLLNSAGEVSIFRARIEQQLSSIEFNVTELSRVTARVKEQLRRLELETEAQILHKHHEDYNRRGDFDPLELDQYSSIQQYSRALAESASDVASVQGLLETLSREAQNLLMQQARVVTELQNGLMRTRMVPFQRHVQRLSRIVRQAANESGKKAEFVVTGASGELDRQVLERMLPPFEHMLRNAVVHGIESPAERAAKGKNATGRIEVQLRREGSEVVITVADDGAGMNLRAIREKALALGLIDRDRMLTDEQAMQLVLEPGFSTASSVTQAAGRGVGMDVVATEIKKLGGALFMESTPGKGTRFNIRLPFTLAISQALIVRVAEELYAVPLPTVESVVRLPRSEVQRHLQEETPTFDYGGQKYRFQHLGLFVGAGPAQLPEQDHPMPLILVRAGEHSTALVVDELVGSREIVVKSLGPQIAGIRGIAGATILGDGRIVIILDVGSLVRSEWRARPANEAAQPRGDRRTFALVVDDSITVRRVTQRLLERNGMRVVTAKDGLDALQVLQEHLPDVILLDIEMPRMDGYEVAAHLRADERLKHIPIVMITSRVGEKHRARAIELGVDDYLGKPYQENQLLDAIEPLVRNRREVAS